MFFEAAGSSSRRDGRKKAKKETTFFLARDTPSKIELGLKLHRTTAMSRIGLYR
jgi:hypothetical protein